MVIPNLTSELVILVDNFQFLLIDFQKDFSLNDINLG